MRNWFSWNKKGMYIDFLRTKFDIDDLYASFVQLKAEILKIKNRSLADPFKTIIKKELKHWVRKELKFDLLYRETRNDGVSALSPRFKITRRIKRLFSSNSYKPYIDELKAMYPNHFQEPLGTAYLDFKSELLENLKTNTARCKRHLQYWLYFQMAHDILNVEPDKPKHSAIIISPLQDSQNGSNNFQEQRRSPLNVEPNATTIISPLQDSPQNRLKPDATTIISPLQDSPQNDILNVDGTQDTSYEGKDYDAEFLKQIDGINKSASAIMQELGLTREKTSGYNNNCFYNALSLQFAHIFGKFEHIFGKYNIFHPYNLKQLILHHLSEHEALYSIYKDEKFNDRSFLEYVNAMEDDYADHGVILAACDLFKLRIHMFQTKTGDFGPIEPIYIKFASGADRTEIKIKDDSDVSCEIYLININNRHFESAIIDRQKRTQVVNTLPYSLFWRGFTMFVCTSKAIMHTIEFQREVQQFLQIFTTILNPRANTSIETHISKNIIKPINVFLARWKSKQNTDGDSHFSARISVWTRNVSDAIDALPKGETDAVDSQISTAIALPKGETVAVDRQISTAIAPKEETTYQSVDEILLAFETYLLTSKAGNRDFQNDEEFKKHWRHQFFELQAFLRTYKGINLTSLMPSLKVFMTEFIEADSRIDDDDMETFKPRLDTMISKMKDKINAAISAIPTKGGTRKRRQRRKQANKHICRSLKK